jgi:hypothetical protein
MTEKSEFNLLGSRGIEPRYRAHQARVLPLNYEPARTKRDSNSQMTNVIDLVARGLPHLIDVRPNKKD